MNSDPYDSAAWRNFGMLDADESAIFDEAMRHDPLLRSAHQEMDRLSAAIAAATVTPIPPKAGQLERLQSRLGLHTPRRGYLWLGVSGWAAAAALAMVLVIDRRDSPASFAPVAGAPQSNSFPAKPPRSAPPALSGAERGSTPSAQAASDAAKTSPSFSDVEAAAKAITRVETKRLVQEIEVLRENLREYQNRDRVLFEAVPGMALPIIMKMNAPGGTATPADALASNDDGSPLTTLLGDSMKFHPAFANAAGLMGMNPADARTTLTTQDSTAVMPPVLADPAATEVIVPAEEPQAPSAIPIYDAARDSGTLVVNHLPAVEEGQAYNLWVTTAQSDKPVYVGSLPESKTAGADSFDFSLGSNMVIPSGFLLTKDPKDRPTPPGEKNTVLKGPPASQR